MLTAIIVAAGSSERMGFDKLFALVSGKPVIAHTIAAFERTDCVDEIILVGRADSLGELRKIIGQPTKVKQVVAGGAERSDSGPRWPRPLKFQIRFRRGARRRAAVGNS